MQIRKSVTYETESINLLIYPDISRTYHVIGKWIGKLTVMRIPFEAEIKMLL